ncbi:hypothetical protein OG401_20990 [Kitasatospora purpeofusca]|uniref:hypothetical protein n=1 Tax=Kitasatospora purpeofusca TaxID=67352 RepID=UPI0022533573|nr:hypothetical protein [Kitasatospora purpeofusca]MCX4686757.1 hypothetical protein [Kitasatospora purpeofusca]
MQYPNWAAGQRITAARLAAMLPTVAVKTALQAVTSSTTLVDDDHLALPVEAGATYVLDGAVFYDGEYSAGDLKVDWAVPAGTAMRWAICGPARGGAAAYASNSSVAGTPLDAGTYGIGGVSSLTSLRPAGQLVTTISGTLRLRWAQHNAHSTPTTIHPPSWIRLQRIA